MAAIMSLKQEIETWVGALARYDNNEFDDAVKEFEKIAETSKILFNIGVIHATLGEHEKAVEYYQRATRLDQYFAIAYFQQGVSNFLLGDFEEALVNFNDTLLYLRGNATIDYTQLGLIFKLYSCEVLFNRGLCYIYLQQKGPGMDDLTFAAKEKVVEDHNVIDEAIRDEAEGYTVFSIPVGVVYRPNEAKVRNLKTKDYLGKARLVAASDRPNHPPNFWGADLNFVGRDDRPPESISFAASNLVKPGLHSRRQQSEPPLNRNMFPPTPPPETDGRSVVSRRSSTRSMPKPALAKLKIQPHEPHSKYEKSISPPDFWPVRATKSANATPIRGRDQGPVLMQRTPTIDEEAVEAYPGQMFDNYQSRQVPGHRSSRGSNQHQRGNSHGHQRFIMEERSGSDNDNGSVGSVEFEMHPGNIRRPSASSANGPSYRNVEMRRIRVKVHTSDDVRNIEFGSTIHFQDLVDRVRDKFALRRRFKIKIKDEDMPEGDMITMGDQDDLEMAISSAKSIAKLHGQELGRIEIWIFES
ncbi:unnamed protein product [Clonostachys byssicola]|uniref:PB1 domain-containing protein n=1 Tax=Clonostachys byssicola TaxID=160290 RepID=A0A9N9URE2_9HYPO|nr:unnamed protein product [Clonostachys byssicola]